MLTENIAWRPVAPGSLPDDGMTVLVEIDPSTPHSEPVWLGYLDGEQWRDVAGDPITVIAWADVPKGTAGVPAGGLTVCNKPDCGMRIAGVSAAPVPKSDADYDLIGESGLMRTSGVPGTDGGQSNG